MENNPELPAIKEKILRIIKREDTNLPTLPLIVTQILKATNNRKTSNGDLAATIANDQGVTNARKMPERSLFQAFPRHGQGDSLHIF